MWKCSTIAGVIRKRCARVSDKFIRNLKMYRHFRISGIKKTGCNACYVVYCNCKRGKRWGRIVCLAACEGNIFGQQREISIVRGKSWRARKTGYKFRSQETTSFISCDIKGNQYHRALGHGQWYTFPNWLLQSEATKFSILLYK